MRDSRREGMRERIRKKSKGEEGESGTKRKSCGHQPKLVGNVAPGCFLCSLFYVLQFAKENELYKHSVVILKEKCLLTLEEGCQCASYEATLRDSLHQAIARVFQSTSAIHLSPPSLLPQRI